MMLFSALLLLLVSVASANLHEAPPPRVCANNGSFVWSRRVDVQPDAEGLSFGAPACPVVRPLCEVGGHVCTDCNGTHGPFCERCADNEVCDSGQVCVQSFSYSPQSFSGRCIVPSGDICSGLLPENSFVASYAPETLPLPANTNGTDSSNVTAVVGDRFVDVSVAFYSFALKPEDATIGSASNTEVQATIFTLSNVTGCEIRMGRCSEASTRALPNAIQDGRSCLFLSPPRDGSQGCVVNEGNYWSNEDSWGDITGVLNQILLPSRFSSSLFENGEDAEVQRTAIGLVCTDPAETENADSEGKSTCAICYDSLHRTDRPTNFARLWESCNLIVLAMNIGSCQDEASFIDFPRPAGTWCEENKGICNGLLYFCIFGLPALIVIFYLALYYYLASHSLSKTGDSNSSGARTGSGAYAVADSHNHHLHNNTGAADNDYYKSLHGAPPAEISLVGEQSSLTRSSWLTFEEVTMTVTKKGGITEHILNGVTGLAGPELFAIMGPSGAGKTTLMDILAGRKNTGTFTGKIEINGCDFTPQERRYGTGYLLQDDVLPGTQTVREFLSFQANLRLWQLPEDLRRLRVDTVIQQLGLKHRENMRIGDHFLRGLSGGEKRRVSIAVELLASSGVLFMDEPTSGLDSASSDHVIDALQRVTEQGRSVVFSVHCPTSKLFNRFGRVLFLSQGGHVLYCGPRSRIVSYFAQQGYKCPEYLNVPEFLLDLQWWLPFKEVKRLAAAFPQSRVARDEFALILRIKAMQGAAAMQESIAYMANMKAAGPPVHMQLHNLAMRNTSALLRHPLLLGVNVLSALGVGLLCGVFYYQLGNNLAGIINRAGLVFFAVAYFMLSAQMSLGTIQDERVMLIRERDAGCYSSGSFLATKLLFEIVPLRVLPTVVFSVGVYFLAGLNPEPSAVATFLYVLMLTNAVGSVICLAVGITFRSTGLAMVVSTIIVLFNLLFSGFLLTTSSESSESAWLPAVQKLAYFSYGFEALLYNEVVGETYYIDASDWGVETSIPANGRQMLKQIGIVDVVLPANVFALLCFLLAFITVNWLVLRFVVKERR